VWGIKGRNKRRGNASTNFFTREGNVGGGGGGCPKGPEPQTGVVENKKNVMRRFLHKKVGGHCQTRMWGGGKRLAKNRGSSSRGRGGKKRVSGSRLRNLARHNTRQEGNFVNDKNRVLAEPPGRPSRQNTTKQKRGGTKENQKTGTLPKSSKHERGPKPLKFGEIARRRQGNKTPPNQSKTT